MAEGGTAGGEIGFVGIGNMGAPMVRCLAKAGFKVRLYDARAEVTTPFAKEGGPYTVAASLSELGACDVVVTMLPDSKVVGAVVLGPDGQTVFGAIDQAVVQAK